MPVLYCYIVIYVHVSLPETDSNLTLHANRVLKALESTGTRWLSCHKTKTFIYVRKTIYIVYLLCELIKVCKFIPLTSHPIKHQLAQ